MSSTIAKCHSKSTTSFNLCRRLCTKKCPNGCIPKSVNLAVGDMVAKESVSWRHSTDQRYSKESMLECLGGKTNWKKTLISRAISTLLDFEKKKTCADDSINWKRKGRCHSLLMEIPIIGVIWIGFARKHRMRLRTTALAEMGQNCSRVTDNKCWGPTCKRFTCFFQKNMTVKGWCTCGKTLFFNRN